MAETASRTHAYEPDYAVPPGETLLETIEAIGLTQAALAKRTGLTTKHINQIIQGVAPITPETALMLEKVTAVPARLWNRLEANFRETLLRLEQRKVRPAEAAWLKSLPLAELIRRGHISANRDQATRLQEVLAFFGVASVQAWKMVWLDPQAAFRKSPAFASKPEAVASWLRIGQIAAQEKECRPFDREGFRRSLGELRSLTMKRPEEFGPQLVSACSDSGVVLVIEPEIPGARASGATQWLSPIKAMIMLSLRYHWADQFWFSFFHEAGHILLHGKRRVFVDGSKTQGVDEDAAHDFAASVLIPPDRESELKQLRTSPDILRFSKAIGIAPGIVVGRLQREGILGYNQLNRLRERYVFAPAGRRNQD